jgi:cell wall assembly regulator SMI1
MPFPITADEIAKTENKLGVSFPPGFKARMARDNGGEIEAVDDYWQLIPFLDTSDRKRLARTCNDIARETASMQAWRGFPADAYVIAQNGTGDYLIMRKSASNPQSLGEEIYFWDHETGQARLVADSIEEL